MTGMYCDYNHKQLPDYWLVMPDEALIPEGIRLEDWQLMRKRPGSRMSDGGRKQVDDEGYAILQFHLPLETLLSLS